MMGKLTILTTDTIHHRYFVRRMAERCDCTIVTEERYVQTRFETHHAFEDQRDEYEREICFGGRPVEFEGMGETIRVQSVNDEAAMRYIVERPADIVVVFGTGKLSTKLISECCAPLLNLHGGDPEEYRGLDSHLWAIYHNDFDGLVTTLHTVNEHLDDGEIVAKMKVEVEKDMPLYQLRHRNTDVCIELVNRTMEVHRDTGSVSSRSQRKKGRYYSYMPATLKHICVEKFQKYTQSI